MAVLSDTDRADTWAAFMRLGSGVGALVLSKVALRAGLNAVDDWVESHLAGLAAVLPATVTGMGPLGVLANTAEIAAASRPLSMSAGIETVPPGDQFDAYTAAKTWVPANASSFFTALAQAGAGGLTSAQAFRLLEFVCRKRMVV